MIKDKHSVGQTVSTGSRAGKPAGRSVRKSVCEHVSGREAGHTDHKRGPGRSALTSLFQDHSH